MPHILWQTIYMTAQAASEPPDGTILSFDKKFLVETGIQWINILVLTAILIFLLYKPVTKFLASRTSRIQAQFDSANKEREEVAALKEQYEGLIAGIELEREELLRQAHKKAVEKSDRLLFNAKREADVLYQRAIAEIELERKNTADDVRKQVIEISALMAARFVEMSIDRETQNQLIEKALTDWEGA